MAGDIIGIHNHGQLQIGDTLDRRRVARVQGHSLFRAGAVSRGAPARSVQGQAAAKRPAASSARKARSRSSSPWSAIRLLLGAVGQLQFEVVAARLASEYKVDAIYDDAGHRHGALAHLSRRQGAPRLRARPRRDARHRRRRQSGLSRAQQIQPTSGDGTLAAGGLPRDARTRATDGARLIGGGGRGAREPLGVPALWYSVLNMVTEKGRWRAEFGKWWRRGDAPSSLAPPSLAPDAYVTPAAVAYSAADSFDGG